ncbi:MAG: TA system VapC family ribonuclease toxin [Steroidobacteraceae bacterium]
MIAVDTNILVYAHREESEWHATAFEAVKSLAEKKSPWAIPWPCIHEFLAIVTHPKIFAPPTPLAGATAQVSAWLESPSVVLLSESGAYWPVLSAAVKSGRIAGPQIHDARIAALCELHGVTELWTADRDFNRFPALKAKNPLVG